MKAIKTPIPGVVVIEPKVFSDERGFFMETYNESKMAELGIPDHFVQDNHSCSSQNVLRGMHYQIHHPQGKLVRAVIGSIFDVVVDLRKSSPAFGRWHGVVLSAENRLLLWAPPGVAHGFQVLSDSAHVLYKTTDLYYPEFERTLSWNDPDLGIEWRLTEEPIISKKDANGIPFMQAEKFA
jgi:dTDP-4-dehydrorhamnose 3,5-epimerase